MFVHEASNFNCNVPGQIALAKSMDQAFKQGYESSQNYLEHTMRQFEAARDRALDLFKKTTSVQFKPTKCESGYFMTVDVSSAASLIPERYFRANVNYEDDAKTLVKQMQFVDGVVPLDFAFCRWLAIEKGLSLMPLSNFCLQESEHRVTNMARVAICKSPETFTDAKLLA